MMSQCSAKNIESLLIHQPYIFGGTSTTEYYSFVVKHFGN